MANYETWDRDELYGEVWSTPMKTLAAKYGISDVGLAKVCRKLMIPLPGRGYWAKKKAGQDVKQPSLPPLKEKIVLHKPTPAPPAPKLSDLGTPAELGIVEQLERASGEFELKRGSLSHPLIVQARAAFKDAKVGNHEILWTRETSLDIRVSKDSLDRALRIMAGLISIIENAGFSVSVEDRDRKQQTVAKIYGEGIRFGLVEKIDRIDVVAPPEGGMLERVLKYGGKPVAAVPSGKLSITVWTSWGSDRRRWSDGKSPLEEQLSRIVAGLIRFALTDRAKERERAAEERERKRRTEEWAQLEATVKAEKSKVRALEEAAANWIRAEKVRSFVSAARTAAVQNDQRTEPGSPFADWITWAERQADRLDPLKESPPSIIDRMPVSEPEAPVYSGYGYQKLERPFRFPKPIWRMK
jgi:hypothetical protein